MGYEFINETVSDFDDGSMEDNKYTFW